MMRRLHESEAGSLPLVLLTAIILGGVVIALFAEVSLGQRTAARDRDVNQSIQVADAGMQAAFTHLAAVDPDDPALPSIGDALTDDGEVSDGSYQWTARRVGRQQWQVRVEGEYRDSARALEAMVGARERFSHAAFGDELVELRGGNSVDSYDGVAFGTGEGAVGSNGEIILRGNAEADWIVRYGDATYNGGGTVHEGIETPARPADLPNIAEEAYAEGGDCFGADHRPYTGEWQLEYGQTYCFSRVEFPAGENQLAGDPADGPVIIYIHPSGNLELKGQGSNGSKTNIVPADRPDARLLQIYLASGEVIANNHTQIAAGIYAPSSVCTGPNAQGELFGSLVCKQIDNRGGWQLHYDERLGDVTDEAFAITGWREELMGTTSFSETE